MTSRRIFTKKHFWTLSILEDHISVRVFVISEPHASAFKKFTKWAGEISAFLVWDSQSKWLIGQNF